MSNSNSYSGGTTLTGGALTATNAGALGTGTILINAASPGATLNLRNDADTTFATTGLTINSSAGGTLTISADQATGAGTNRTLTLGGAVSIANGKTLTIATGNGYTLSLGATSGSGASGGSASMSFAGGGNSIISSLTGSSTAATTSTANFNGSGISTITGNVTDNTGALSLTKGTAAGTLVLQGTGSNYSGSTTISNGTIRTAVATNGFGNTSGISIGGAGILDLRNNSSAVFSNGITSYSVSTSSSGATINVDNNNSAATGNTLTIGTISLGAHTLNVTGGNSYTLATGAATLTGAATFNPTSAKLSVASATGTNQGLTLDGTASGSTIGAITTGTGTLTKSNSSTWSLTGVNTYTGTTQVSGGTLLLSGSGSLANGASGSRINVSSGATFDISGVTSGASVSILSETGSGNGGSAKVGSKALTVNGGSGTYYFNNLGLSGDTGTFTMNASGQTLNLYGNSFYTGSTTLTAGTLTTSAAMSSLSYLLSGGSFTTLTRRNWSKYFRIQRLLTFRQEPLPSERPTPSAQFPAVVALFRLTPELRLRHPQIARPPSPGKSPAPAIWSKVARERRASPPAPAIITRAQQRLALERPHQAALSSSVSTTRFQAARR